jgi:hypothetical protein
MRIVTDQRGKRSIEIESPGCGYTWLSTAKSGKTTCPECRTRVHIPAALGREAYDPTPVISYGGPDGYDPDAPTDPEASRREMERVFEEMGPLPHDFAPRTLTAQERRDLGYVPTPSTQPASPRRARRSRKRTPAAPGGGWLVGLATAGVMAAEVRRALKPTRTPSPRARVPTVPAQSRQAQPSVQPSGQYRPRGPSAPRTLSRGAKLSCLHTAALAVDRASFSEPSWNARSAG